MLQLAVIVILQSFISTSHSSSYLNNSFPSDFMFGAGTSAYQIEGAWNKDGRGETIWDNFVHGNASNIVGNATGDISCNSYYKYKEDIRLAYLTGLNAYHFSIAWTRILPKGSNKLVSVKGVNYYQELLKEVKSYNLTPIVTLYHWDLPQFLQTQGGWTNKKTVDYFVNYTRVVFDTFKTVKYWITINDPRQICRGGYGIGTLAPGTKDSGVSDYKCAYYVLKAHAAVYHLYKTEFSNLNGLVSLALESPWSEPATKDKNDVSATERSMMFDFGLYANPIFIGDWPTVVKERVQYRSKNKKERTRLPAFTDEEIKEIKGTADFMAVKFFTTRLISDDKEAPYDETSFENDLRVKETLDPNWTINTFGKTIVPGSMRSFLKWIKDTYKNPSIIITANGIPDNGTFRYDEERVHYLGDYLNAVLEAIDKDKVRVHGYMYWSLLDSFEWTQGYSQHYGLYRINFDNPYRDRIAKSSVEYYRQVATTKKIPDPSMVTTIHITTSTTPQSTSSTTAKPTTASSVASIVFCDILLLSTMMVFWTMVQV
nr:myrosinase 1-like isoform X1 [Leptinotarsa decemlineata]XP_023026915.1 myrosinase 1-like isoform X2 [Leptinotarsa decemlineata]XP_023026916.1 myrosinase 1-like isoform X3 [Leptinotarsa decemlineata]